MLTLFHWNKVAAAELVKQHCLYIKDNKNDPRPTCIPTFIYFKINKYIRLHPHNKGHITCRRLTGPHCTLTTQAPSSNM